MNINKNNYEIYLMDYLDGKLTPLEVSEVLLFLEQHPGIKAEFEGLDAVPKNVSENEGLFDISFLKKPAFTDVQDEYEPLLIAEVEGDLTDDESIRLGQAKQLYPELNRDAALFAAARMIPEQILFPGKQRLKKRIPIPLYQQTWVRIAAVLLLVGFAGIAWFNLNDEQQQYADAQTTAVIQKDKSTGFAQTGLKQTADAAVKEREEKKINGQQQKNTPAIASKPNHPVQNDAGITTERQTIPVLISSVSASVQPSVSGIKTPQLAKTNGYIKYAPPHTAAPENYTDIKEFAARRFEKEKQQLLGSNEEGKTLNLLQAINKATGENIKVDTNAEGKIKRFEIAGLGFEWSHSK